MATGGGNRNKSVAGGREEVIGLLARLGFPLPLFLLLLSCQNIRDERSFLLESSSSSIPEEPILWFVRPCLTFLQGFLIPSCLVGMSVGRSPSSPLSRYSSFQFSRKTGNATDGFRQVESFLAYFSKTIIYRYCTYSRHWAQKKASESSISYRSEKLPALTLTTSYMKLF